MAFMERDVQFGEWYEVDGRDGTDFIPADVVGSLGLNVGETMADNDHRFAAAVDSLTDYLESITEVSEITLRQGWGARLSAPGYMDCTEWSVFESEQDAIAYLNEQYPEDDDDE